MKKEIKIPSMGESVVEATIGGLISASGSYVKIDSEILELETDKVNQVLYAPVSGTLTLTVNSGDIVKIDQVIGYIDSDSAISEGRKIQEKPQESIKPIIPPSKIVVKESSEKETRKKMSNIRKVIASRLLEAQHTTAMLTTFNEVDMSAIMDLRDRYKDIFMKKYQAKLGFMSWFVKATVASLKIFPDLNSYIDGEDIVHREYYDISIAVGTDKGLIVPVIRHCDRLSFSEIELAIESFSNRAKSGELTVDELRGGGFTITNGGVYGSLLSTPILNPPQCGILGMHKIEKRPVVINDEIVIRPMMYIALSYDHRIVDGKAAVSFLVHLKNLLEDPSRILLDL
jgi:2-oxoglutarate dehydrogenase E2 component (dihydrolipoamide succinyltransferase)